MSDLHAPGKLVIGVDPADKVWFCAYRVDDLGVWQPAAAKQRAKNIMLYIVSKMRQCGLMAVGCDCTCHECCIPQDAWCDECREVHDDE